jgi:CHAT domain-containing protein
VVVADPDFNLGGTRRNAPWTPLSGTYEEGRRVAERLGVTLLTGADATEGALKRVRSPSVLHLATHGFFHADEEDEALLLRAGLVLAGANTASAGETPPAEAQDGVLTADDVAQLDLLGTHVVVLSACETGLGRVQAGEGVLGLRRAFVLAGADTIVMSLWKVPDYESLELMDAFYDRLLAGAGRAEALRDARRELRDAGHSAAAYGAFICQGDPGPLPAGALTPR